MCVQTELSVSAYPLVVVTVGVSAVITLPGASIGLILL